MAWVPFQGFGLTRVADARLGPSGPSQPRARAAETRRAVPRLSARCPPRNPAPATTTLPARPSLVPAAYRPRIRATNEPRKRNVASSVPSACTAPTGAGARHLRPVAGTRDCGRSSRCHSGSGQERSGAACLGPTGQVEDGCTHPAPERQIREERMHRVPQGVGVQRAAPCPVDHRTVEDLLRTSDPLGERALAHGPGHPLRKWKVAHAGSVRRRDPPSRCRTGRTQLCASMEAELSGGQPAGAVAVVVGAVVVPGAEEQAVGEVRAAAGGPGSGRRGGLRTRRRGCRSPRRGRCVPDGHGLALGGAEQAAGRPRSRISESAPSTAGRMFGGAGQPAGLAGGDRGVADQGGAEAVAEPVEVDGHHQGGGIAAVQRHPVGVDRFQERAEGVAELLVVGPPVGIGAPGLGCCRGR